MWAAFLVGLAGGIAATPHCLGMCGGFPLHLARSSRRGMVGLRQVLFVLGKSFTYMFLGALAAALGIIVFKNTAFVPGAPLLRLLAGLITILFGLLMMGFRLPPIRALQGVSDTGFVRSVFGGLLSSPGPLGGFVLGLGVGFLPCPLPMGMLAVAAASRDVLHGIALMAGVGLGTAPGLLAVGLFGVGLDRKFARVGMRAAGVLVLAIGLMMVGRATGAIHSAHPVSQTPPSCCGGAQR